MAGKGRKSQKDMDLLDAAVLDLLDRQSEKSDGEAVHASRGEIGAKLEVSPYRAYASLTRLLEAGYIESDACRSSDGTQLPNAFVITPTGKVFLRGYRVGRL